jgi:imidazolonepropionase
MNASLVIRNARIATMVGGWSVIESGAVAVHEGKIAWVGEDRNAPAGAQVVDANGAWLTPGLIDCHTHLVYAGDRSQEFEMRLAGKSYQEIAAAGGGILSTVAATRAASEETLLKLAIARGKDLVRQGVTTLDIKSGYGLDLTSEQKMLRVARQVGQQLGVRVVTGFLAAHACPGEYKGRADEYIDAVIAMLPHIEADYCDAFTETIGFTAAQTRRLFVAAKARGMGLRLHADQLSDSGAANLAAEMGACSADHVEYTSREGSAAMGAAGTVAVLLPTAYACLREKQQPPIAAFREFGVKMAVASDCNPGTSPSTQLHLAMHQACVLFGLSPEEAWSGVTASAAAALGLQGVLGQIEVGQSADLALWSFDHPRQLVLQLRDWSPTRTWLAGRERLPASTTSA